MSERPQPRRKRSDSLTVAEFAARYRMGKDKVRCLIRKGVVRAVNIASTTSGRPRYVITPEAIEEFERVRSAAEPKPPPRRKRERDMIDFFPDDPAEKEVVDLLSRR
jgi:hypothetical protein